MASRITITHYGIDRISHQKWLLFEAWHKSWKKRVKEAQYYVLFPKVDISPAGTELNRLEAIFRFKRILDEINKITKKYFNYSTASGSTTIIYEAKNTNKTA